MSTQTTNYNLTKIDGTDAPPDITVLNANFDIIDAKLKAALNGNRESALSIANGGTGATNKTNANKAFISMGTSIPATDLASNYPEGMYYFYCGSPTWLPYAPSNYGIILSVRYSTEISQIWFSLPTGAMFYRSGATNSGWDGVNNAPNRGWKALSGGVYTATVG